LDCRGVLVRNEGDENPGLHLLWYSPQLIGHALHLCEIKDVVRLRIVFKRHTAQPHETVGAGRNTHAFPSGVKLEKAFCRLLRCPKCAGGD